jgi:hypothetical protein
MSPSSQNALKEHVHDDLPLLLGENHSNRVRDYARGRRLSLNVGITARVRSM